MSNELSEIIICRGYSMNPTLKSGDFLEVVPYINKNVQCGDVIVFALNQDQVDKYVVHRVVSIDHEGIKTQGDNNDEPDPYVVQYGDIIGYVARAYRGNRQIVIYGGLFGRAKFIFNRICRILKNSLISIFRPSYRYLVKWGVPRRLLSRWTKMRFVPINRPRGTEIQLFMGRLLIGRKLPKRDRWWIRRPFRLFVDESTLINNIGICRTVCSMESRNSSITLQ